MRSDSEAPMQASQDAVLAEAIKRAEYIRITYVDTTLNWYSKHVRYPFFFFRLSGLLTVVLAASLPAVAATDPHSHPCVSYLLPAMSITVAALTGLSSFYRWERTWRGREIARGALEQTCAKWELEMTNARLNITPEDRVNHVYLATDDLLTNLKTITASEADGFFSSLQFPQSDRTSKT